MGLGWQDIVALGVVALAVVYLVRRWLKKRRSPAGMPGCERCSDCSAANRPLVSLEPPRRRGEK